MYGNVENEWVIYAYGDYLLATDSCSKSRVGRDVEEARARLGKRAVALD